MTIMTAAAARVIAMPDKHDCHDSDSIAMPGKYDHHDSDTIAMPGKARRNISRVSRRCLPLYSARHHHAARQASRRRTPGITTPHGMRRIRLHARNYFRTRAWRRIRTAYGSNYFPS